MIKQTIAMTITALVAGGAVASEWGYGENNGPDNWGKIAGECAKGQNQSPVNITRTTSAEMKAPRLDYQGTVTSLTNNGHTLQAGIEGKNTLSVDGKVFELKQFHFHTPSENLIKNRQYPLEAHLVHADADGNLAVVAIMYQPGEKNAQLASLAETLPKEKQTVALNHTFAMNTMLPEDAGYYRFNGSLTTPPCSEGVRWFVLKQPQTLTDGQAEELHTAMGTNNRPVQKLNARMVLSAN